MERCLECGEERIVGPCGLCHECWQNEKDRKKIIDAGCFTEKTPFAKAGAPDEDCITLPDGSCVASNCKLHGPIKED